MNLALHGFLLHVFMSILNLQHGSLLCSAGEPGYLDFDNLPETNFSCQGKVIGGYYADVEAGCQMFHVCTIGQKDEIMDIKFLCLNGTVFDQETRVCERVDEVDCSKSERFYNLNLELYGNNAVTLSLHENNDDDVDPSDSIDDHQQRTTSARPTTTTTTTTTTSKPNKPSTTPASSSFSHPTGYPQHFQPQPPFPQVHTSQSKSLYDDKNGGYHHQYIFHNGERSNNQPATSYQLFSNQGVSSTTVQPPQIHQIRFSSTASPQIIHNEPSTVAPLFHVTSSTIQTLLNSNANNPALINPIFHNHGIASTTEQFSLHSNNPRETSEYRESVEHNIRPLEAIQSTNKGKVSKLTISPVPTPSESSRSVQTKIGQSSQQQRISGNFLPTPATDETTIRSFYPTLRSASKSTQSTSEITQHIHVLPSVPIPQLKPHQITINLPPPDIQRIVQNPSPLLPSQSRVIVTAKASVSDESGRPLNTTQLVTLPLPTIPASYDEYKEGDETFDPFYRDVPKIRNARHVARQLSNAKTPPRHKRSVGQTKSSMVSFVYGGDSHRRQDVQAIDISGKERNREKVSNDNSKDFKSIKESLMKFRDILFGGEFTEDSIRSVFGGSTLQNMNSNRKVKNGNKVSLEDLETKASKNIKSMEYEDDTEEETENKETKIEEEEYPEDTEIPVTLHTKSLDADEEYIDLTDYSGIESDGNNAHTEIPGSEKTDVPETSPDIEEKIEKQGTLHLNKNETEHEKRTELKRVIDVVILDPNEYLKLKSSDQGNLENVTEQDSTSTDIPILSTTEQFTTESTLTMTDDFSGKEHSEYFKKQSDEIETNKQLEKIENNEEEDSMKSKKQDVEAEPNKQFSKIENNEEKDSKNLEEQNVETESSKWLEEIESNEEEVRQKESEKEKPKERVEQKPNVKRKSSRIRSFSGKISSRKKDLKNEEIEMQHDEAIKSIGDQITIHETVETTNSPIVTSEVEQIDKHIFDEPESQTFKEVDTRAVGYHSSYAKSLQVGKDQNTGKDNRKNEANEYEIIDAKKNEDKVDESLDAKDKSTVFILNDHEVKSDEKSVEELDSAEMTEENISVEQNSYKEESSIEHGTEKEETTTVFSDQDSKDDSEEDLGTSHEVSRNSRREKSMKFEDSSKEVSSHRRDKSEKFSNEEEEERKSQEFSTIKGEEINSQEVSSEYPDSTEAFDENTHEMSIDDDYKDTGSHDDLTISSEHSNSEEIANFKEGITKEYDEYESSPIDQENSTEGVLKFTDELPKEKKENVSDGKKSSESVENIAHDYVDDNYEPDNYKERESTESNNLSDEKTNKEVDTDKIKEDKTGSDTKKTDEDKIEATTMPLDRQTMEIEEETENFNYSSTEAIDLQQTTIPSMTIMSTMTTITPTTTSITSPTTTPTITTTTTTTRTTTTTMTPTTTTTTTTVRPTPPKLFKPISARKSYNYIPPTTTPNPVIIKPRHSLLNPKPAKPLKSYNELAPKPIIRKFPSLVRKSTTTVPTTTIKEDDFIKATELLVTMTETPVITTEASKSEENVLEDKPEKDQDRSSVDEPMQNDQILMQSKDDQESSPSEQKSPPNLKKEANENSVQNNENITPYPALSLSTLASTIQDTLKEVLPEESTSTESEMSTTPKGSTFMDVEILSTTIPTVTSTPDEPYHSEIITKPIVDEEISIASSTKSDYQDTTEISYVTEPPMIVETTTKDSEEVKSATARLLGLKSSTLNKRDGFSCLERELYRFYNDPRDCRLFHYCSPGFTSSQVLDIRFVCEEGTVFDEPSHSCRHNVQNRGCLNRQ
ncbi:uncharacterized protein LOC143154848 isoform X2 [Ptiloglossa arizonensis]|uniref:uncharacterized protein LOC143154848 isoform X2 n=1 Tax=Ptiloglossa arizonensis TaxID=3350558 RepID=UPI003F9F2D1C